MPAEPPRNAAQRLAGAVSLARALSRNTEVLCGAAQAAGPELLLHGIRAPNT